MDAARTNRAHQLHFDPRAFNANGDRDKGSLAKMRPEDADRAIELMQGVHNARRELLKFLKSKGHKTPAARSRVMTRLRKGWRPRK